MTTNQPIWKLAGTIGDINPFDYSGGFVYIDTTGVYAPEMEWIEVNEDRKTSWTVYRTILDRCELAQVNGEPHLVPFGFASRTDLPYPIGSYVEWFDDSMHSVARCMGQDVNELVDEICSDEPMSRANAYLSLAQYHGWENFDSDPLQYSDRSELESRYSEKNSTLKSL